MKCEDCRYFEPFNGVCFNSDSSHCADMPWQFGIDGCDKGVKKSLKESTDDFLYKS